MQRRNLQPLKMSPGGDNDAGGAAAARRSAAACSADTARGAVPQQGGGRARVAVAQQGGGCARVSQVDRLKDNVYQLGGYLHFVNGLPKATSTNLRERQLAGLVARIRQKTAKLKDWQRKLLLNTHPNLLKPCFTPAVDDGPSPEWQACFNNLASSAGDDDLKYRDPASNNSYLSSTGSKSLSEYLIRRIGVIIFFKPADLNPSSKFVAGDVRINLLYVRHPHLRPTATVNPSVTDTSKRLVSRYPGHVFCGALFQKADLLEGLCKEIRRLQNSLLPEKVWHDMQQCDSAQSLVRVIQQNLDLFDTHHHDSNGRFSKGVVRPTAKSTSKQPRWTTFSCSVTPSSIFPELRTSVEQLFSYVGGCRPTVDCRC